MKSLVHLFLRLPFWQGRNRIRSAGIEDALKNGILLLFGLGVGWAEYVFFERFWTILGAVPYGYALLLPRFFSILGSFLFAFLAYSSVLTALSSYYQSEDLALLLASPLRLPWIILFKWVDVAIRSGVTLILLSLPPMAALGRVLHLSSAFYLAYLAAVLAFAGIAVSLGVWIAMLMVAVFPVKRMHQTVAFLGLSLAVFLITALRFLHLETLWSEQAASNPLILFLQYEPGGWIRYAPGSLFAHAIQPFVLENPAGVSGLAKLAVLSGAIIVLTALAAKHLFLRGWWKSQEQADPEVHPRGWTAKPGKNTAPGPLRILLWKDWLIFKRDPSVWTQLFMMIPLAALYLLNLTFLPVQGETLAPFFALADVGLIGLIIAAVSARFLFPAASREGRPVWIPAVSPVASRTIIFQKVIFLIPPVMLLSAVMLLLSSKILRLPPDMARWCLGYGLLVSLQISLMAVFLGFCFPSYKFRHVLEVSLGKGAFLFMMLALAQIMLLLYSVWSFLMSSPAPELPFWNGWLLTWLVVWSGVTLFCYWAGQRRWARAGSGE
ncbi:MAG: hypothetical protein HPY51_18670 [Candidatus Omnitrophica bacterium]|nr:hypothetical protein [Candidatus Omnitrophota bacterium]